MAVRFMAYNTAAENFEFGYKEILTKKGICMGKNSNADIDERFNSLTLIGTHIS